MSSIPLKSCGLIDVAFSLFGCKNSPLEKYGVQFDWKYEGATSSYPSVHVWIDYGGQKIRSPLVFSGIRNPELKFKDVDGDGVEDIIFGNKKHKQIVLFKPALNDSPPRFILIKDDSESG